MSHYSNGSRVERLVRDDLRALGFAVVKAGGSKGAADLVAFAPGQVLFVQVKRTNALLPPAQRTALVALADHLGLAVGLPVVATKAARRPIAYRALTGTGPKDWIPFQPAVILP